MSTAFTHIACCVDDSDASRRALAEARRLRALGDGRLSIVHVAQYPVPYAIGFGAPQPNPTDLTDAARAWLDEVASSVPEATPVLLEGYPPSETCAWAAQSAVDLLICAAHRNLPQRIALGSFAHYLVNHAPCAVMILRPPAAS